MTGWMETIHALIGHSGETLTLMQMLLRGIVVFILGLALIRLAAPRIFSRATPIDIVLAVVIGSNLSRTLTGNAPFFETMTVTAILVLTHSVLARLAARFRPLGTLVKGKPRILAKHGDVNWSAMQACALGQRDLLAAVRSAGGQRLDEIDLAVLERSGDIKVVLAKRSDNPALACKSDEDVNT